MPILAIVSGCALTHAPVVDTSRRIASSSRAVMRVAGDGVDPHQDAVGTGELGANVVGCTVVVARRTRASSPTSESACATGASRCVAVEPFDA